MEGRYIFSYTLERIKTHSYATLKSDLEKSSLSLSLSLSLALSLSLLSLSLSSSLSRSLSLSLLSLSLSLSLSVSLSLVSLSLSLLCGVWVVCPLFFQCLVSTSFSVSCIRKSICTDLFCHTRQYWHVHSRVNRKHTYSGVQKSETTCATTLSPLFNTKYLITYVISIFCVINSI